MFLNAHPFRNGRHLSSVLMVLTGLCSLVTGCAIEASDEPLGIESSALCKVGQLSSDATGPASGNVTVTANPATCAAGEIPEYRFVYRRDGTSALVELQDWSTKTSVTWNTAGLASGGYHVIAYVRSAGSVKYQSYAYTPVLVGQVCDAVSLSSDLASPQSVGTALGLTAAATCTGGLPEYQFTAKPRGGPGVMIQDWSSSASVSWNTLGLAAGPYTLFVSTRATGNLAFEAQRTLAFRLGETCALPTLTTTPSSPGEPGADVVLNASTSCTGAVTPQFRFWYRPSAAKTYALLQDWGDASSTRWHTAGLPADNYGLMVETRANDYAGSSQARRLSTFVLGPSCSAVTLVASPNAPPPLGALLAFTANATCRTGGPEYRFSVRSPGSTTFDEFRGWGEGTASFPTAGLAGGEYAFLVETRGVGNIASYQARRALSYDLGGVCNKVALVATPPPPSFPATSVHLTAAATCVNGGVAEYQFAARTVGARDWTILRDWGSASAIWDASQAPWNNLGDYQLLVSARGQGQLGPAESTRVLPYSFTTGCVESSSYDLSINGSYTEVFDRRQCRTFSGGYQRTLQATVVDDTVQVTGYGFDGSYPIIERTAAGFTAQAGSLYAPGFECGDAIPGADNFGQVTLAFDCAKAKVTFNAICQSDISANGCYPDYIETATGSGSRAVVCGSGYEVSQGQCIDVNECTSGSPCAGAEACTNTPGSFSCSCNAPAKVCGGACVQTLSDDNNCGAFGISCSGGQHCSGGACACPDGLRDVDGTCIIDCPFGFTADSQSGSCVRIPEPTAEDFVAVAAGNAVCGLRSDGSARCWGYNAFGGAVPPALTLSAIDPGETHSCGITTSGAAVCWGNPQSGALLTPSGTFVAISTGESFACGIRQDGALSCWGSNAAGESAPPAGTFTVVSAGGAHACGLRTNGTLACWGRNWYGESTPPSGTFTAVASGSVHSCALRTDGMLVCWGYNGDGQTTPPEGTYQAVAASGAQSCALRLDGSAVCWPNEDAPSGSFRAIDVGGGLSCGLRADSKILCWGNNGYGQCSPPSAGFRTISAGIGGPCETRNDGSLRCWGIGVDGTFKRVSSSGRHSCGIRMDDTLTCWGENGSGQATPPSGSFIAIATGGDHTCGVRQDGSLACWGLAAEGRTTPPAGTFIDIAAGDAFTCALRSDGTMTCWGATLGGRTIPLPGVYTSLSAAWSEVCAVRSDAGVDCRFESAPPGSFQSVSAGLFHNCGLRTDGTAACWGDNYAGMATAPSGTFLAVMADHNYSCGIRSDGRDVCWGTVAR